MNRRSFLKLLTTTAAAAVAGLRPRPEPGEMVTRVGNGSVMRLDDPAISAEDCRFVLADKMNWWHNENGEQILTYVQRVPSDLLDDTQCDLEAYIEAEIWNTLIDREFIEGSTAGAVLGVLEETSWRE